MADPRPNPFSLLYLAAGFALVAGGAAWIYRPAGLIAAGLMLLGAAFTSVRRGSS